MAKIFDSHPDVLYRHEPDITHRSRTLPFLLDSSDIDRFAGEAEEYLRQLRGVRSLRAAGSRPFFAKNYLSSWQEWVRSGVTHILQLLEKATGEGFVNHFPVPDFVDGNKPGGPVHVLKSVSSMGRTQVYLRAMPGAKAVIIIRHPCGTISSMLRGRETGKLEQAVRTGNLAKTAYARSRSLTQEALDSATTVEKLAWQWVILNECALGEGDGSGSEYVLRYEDLCAEPTKVAKQLFDFAGLSWNQQTEAFLSKSSSGPSDTSYFSVIRNPLVAANKWRETMSAEDVATIERIVGPSRSGRLFFPE